MPSLLFLSTKIVQRRCLTVILFCITFVIGEIDFHAFKGHSCIFVYKLTTQIICSRVGFWCILQSQLLSLTLKLTKGFLKPSYLILKDFESLGKHKGSSKNWNPLKGSLHHLGNMGKAVITHTEYFVCAVRGPEQNTSWRRSSTLTEASL